MTVKGDSKGVSRNPRNPPSIRPCSPIPSSTVSHASDAVALENSSLPPDPSEQPQYIVSPTTEKVDDNSVPESSTSTKAIQKQSTNNESSIQVFREPPPVHS